MFVVGQLISLIDTNFFSKYGASNKRSCKYFK